MKLKFEEFIGNSKTFNGIEFSGNYTMKIEHFSEMLYHYIKCGENLLDIYSDVVYNSWNEFYIENDDMYTDAINNISKIDSLQLVSSSKFIKKAYEKVNNSYLSYQKRLENEDSKERIEACRYTSRDDVKSKVFELHGKICLRCGSIDNITLDHINPVHKGGENSIENLQPLCNRCNSSKGIKVKDYRK